MFKSNKGYSLVEIGVGIIILTTFLLVSIGLFNGAYTNYRRIKQRNIAINSAVSQIETMLQTDANELTGFFVRKKNSDNRYELKPNDLLTNFVKNHFSDFKARYAKIMEESKDSITLSEAEEYIEKDSYFAVDLYIQDQVNNDSSISSTDLANGNYGFLVSDSSDNWHDSKELIIEIYNGQQIPTDDSNIYVTTNGQPLKIRKTVNRLSAEDQKAYGNEVLKLKVEVFYSEKFGDNIPEEEMEKFVVETVKVTKNS